MGGYGIITTKLVGVLGIVKIFPLGVGWGSGNQEGGFGAVFVVFGCLGGVWAGFVGGLDDFFVRMAGTGRGQKPAIVKIPITPIRLVGVYMRVCKNIEP